MILLSGDFTIHELREFPVPITIVTDAVFVTVPSVVVAVIRASPFATAVTMPAALTVATFSLLLV
ncbi:hypothetical protein D3C71_2116290 [compost metagenome]